MTDTVIKGNGKSRKMKAPSDMPDTYEQWRAKMLSGDAYIDMSLNGDGCDVVGTPLSKDTLLKDATATKLGLSSTEKTVDAAINKLFTYASDGKTKVAAAVTGKGVNTPSSATFDQIAANIGKITTEQTPEISVSTTGLITATCGSKSATQQLPTQAAQTITPGTTPQTIPAGKYTTGVVTVEGDANLLPENIKAGIEMFEVVGEITPAPKYMVVTNDDFAITCSVDASDSQLRNIKVTITLPTSINRLFSYALEFAFKSENQPNTLYYLMSWGVADKSPVSSEVMLELIPESNMIVNLITRDEGIFTLKGANSWNYAKRTNLLILECQMQTSIPTPIYKVDLLPANRGFIFYD